MPMINLSTGATFHYEAVGDGFPVVLVHGRFGTAEADFPTLMPWLVGRGYRVLGPSLRGYGQSLPKPRDYPLDFYHRDARDLIAFLDALGIGSAHLLGYSDGGETALVAAGLAPTRFRSVAVWGAVGYMGEIMRPAVQRNYPADWMDEATKALHGIDDPNPMVLEWVHALKYMIDSGGDVSLSLAPAITCPVLLILGETDRLNPVEYGQRFVDAAPRGRLAVFPTGHGCHDEAPALFQQIVGDFLSSADAQAATPTH